LSGKRGNGEGSITKRKDGRWMARYTVPTAKGPKRRHVYGKTRKAAADKLAKVLSDRTDGIVYDDENTTVDEYLDAWLKGAVRGSIRQSTYDRDAYLIQNHVKPALGRIRLKNLSSAHVQASTATGSTTGSAPRPSTRYTPSCTRRSPEPWRGRWCPGT
jgi:integrase